MARPSNTQKLTFLTPVTLGMDKTPIHYLKVDKKGCIQTNKRAYSTKKAYVILGTCAVLGNHSVYIPLGTEVWTCEITSRGEISTIGSCHEGMEVTVIIV